MPTFFQLFVEGISLFNMLGKENTNMKITIMVALRAVMAGTGNQKVYMRDNKQIIISITALGVQFPLLPQFGSYLRIASFSLHFHRFPGVGLEFQVYRYLFNTFSII
jgi:hypothetical protein